MPYFQASSWQRLLVWPIFFSYFFPLRSGSPLSASDYSHMQYTKHSYKVVLPSFPRASPCHHHFCHMPKPFGTQPYFGTNCDSVPMSSRVKFVTWNLERKMRGIMKWIITQLSWNHQICFYYMLWLLALFIESCSGNVNNEHLPLSSIWFIQYCLDSFGDVDFISSNATATVYFFHTHLILEHYKMYKVKMLQSQHHVIYSLWSFPYKVIIPKILVLYI